VALLKTRIIVSAVVFAANLALSLSYGTAEAQAPRHGPSQASRPHTMRFAERPAVAEASSKAVKPKTPMNSSADYPEFCSFSRVNAC
jgi:hypothetical protein